MRNLETRGLITIGVEETPRENKEQLSPEPKAPPEAKTMSSGTELKSSEELRKKRAKTPAIEGSRRLTCKRCGHFLVEVKSKDFEAATICSRCKTENYFSFAHQELK
jgi:formylmethanofuran dehydrogenase subunit E